MNNVVHVRTGKRGRRPILPGRVRFSMFPDGRGECRRYLYAFGLEDGKAKIGITSAPRSRLLMHWQTYGTQITWVHVFAPLIRCEATRYVERDALNLASKCAARVGKTEMFVGLSRADACASVRQAIAAALKPRAKAAA